MFCDAVPCVFSRFSIISVRKIDQDVLLLVYCSSSSRCSGLVCGMYMSHFLVILTWFFMLLIEII